MVAKTVAAMIFFVTEDGLFNSNGYTQLSILVMNYKHSYYTIKLFVRQRQLNKMLKILVFLHSLL